jgi:hypothetical protein
MYRSRLATDRFLRLTEHFPAVVVVGARQVGKTTLLQHVLGPLGAEFVVFDPVADVEGARAEPDLFLDGHRTPLVLDEIQYAPEVVPALKRRIDRNRAPGQYVLTGSQQWEVMRSLSESLAGRAVFLDLEGFCLAEIAREVVGRSWLERWLADPEGFIHSRPKRLTSGRPLYERIWRGFLPDAESLDAAFVPDFHAGYLRTYVERDARYLGQVEDWQQFGRFFRLAAALTAQEVNGSQFGRDIGATPQTARRWLDMLMATFQWHEVPPWSGNVVKRVSKRPKGYLADCGLAAAALRISSPRALSDHPTLGALFETAVVGEIRRLCTVLSPKPAMHHWRSHGGAEVDLILERDGILYPMEIRATAHPAKRDTSGLRAFRSTHQGARIAPGLVIAPTETLVRIGEHELAIPWDLAPSA